jgi:hypothetical protein
LSDKKKKPTRIFGYISNSKRRPIAGVNVYCEKTHQITLFDGSYKFEIEPGWHTISVELKGFVKQEKEILVEDSEEGRMDFQLKEEIGDSRIYGSIINKETGENIGKGLVFIIRPTTNRNSKIDPKTGFYEFDKLTSGTYDIWTSILQYEDEKSTITIGDHEEKKHDFHIKKKEDEEVPWG